MEVKGRHLNNTAIDTGGTIIDAFTIEDQPLPVELSVNHSDTVDFGEVYTGFRDTLQLDLMNSGYDVLQITNANIIGEGFITVTDTLQLELGDSATIPVIFYPSAKQEYSALISVSSNDSYNPVISLNLKGKGVLPPNIVFSPDSLRENLAISDTSLHEGDRIQPGIERSAH